MVKVLVLAGGADESRPTVKELPLMRRILLVLTVAALMVAVMAVPAFAVPKTCAERGFFGPCLPGQHVQTSGSDGSTSKNVGNPHYPIFGGPKTGDPHGSTLCNPTEQDPHAPPCLD